MALRIVLPPHLPRSSDKVCQYVRCSDPKKEWAAVGGPSCS